MASQRPREECAGSIYPWKKAERETSLSLGEDNHRRLQINDTGG